jgi:hypothetical protein
MPDTDSKGWKGLASDFIKSPPALLLVAGVFFLAIAVTASVGIKDYQLTAEGGIWRYVSAGCGALLILACIALYWLETHRKKLKRPGPYTFPGDFPIRIDGPDKVIVYQNGQTITVKGIRKGAEWPEYRVMLMHVPAKDMIYPRFGDLKFSQLQHHEFSWEAEINTPDVKTIPDGGLTWRFAFFYVGPNAQRLVDHHEMVCKYFAPKGERPWPEIKNPPEEFVQCSTVLRVTFVLSQNTQALTAH